MAPPYPGAAGFPRYFDASGRLYDASKRADFALLDAAGLKIWTDAHAEDARLFPGATDAPYGSERWSLHFKWNGQANSIATPLPFPNMIGWETYFPQYTATSTKQDHAPGETPFNQCDNYRTDGNTALADFGFRYAALAETDYIPGTRLTKAQARTNIKVEYNEAAKAYGCTTTPFPEALGATRMPENPPPVPTATTGGNKLNGQTITGAGDGPYVAVDTGTADSGIGAPADGGSVGQVTPAGDPQATPGNGRMWLVILAAGVLVYAVTQEG